MSGISLTARAGVWDLGRDLWRKEEKLAHFLQNPLWSQIFSVLSKKRPLRLGLDICFTSQVPEAHVEEVLFPLEEKCSIQGFLGGVLFALKPRLRLFFVEAHRLVQGLTEELCISPTEEGNGVQLYYFLGLTSAISQYQPSPNDPLRDWLKALGIVVGGILPDKTHPILYR